MSAETSTSATEPCYCGPELCSPLCAPCETRERRKMQRQRAELREQKRELLNFARKVADHFDSTDAPLGIEARELIKRLDGVL